MPNEHEVAEARKLIAQAGTVARASGKHPIRSLLVKVSGGRLGRIHGWPVIPDLGAPWQDTISAERLGWRMRSAHTAGARFAFAVDYQIYRRCHLGWVEMPHTDPRYQGCRIAAAGLAALRSENPGLSWHTLGGHFTSTRGFW
jgi:hypothetical protein